MTDNTIFERLVYYKIVRNIKLYGNLNVSCTHPPDEGLISNFDCFCIPKRIYDFTCKYFNLSEKDCNCVHCGKDGNGSIGFSLYDSDISIARWYTLRDLETHMHLSKLDCLYDATQFLCLIFPFLICDYVDIRDFGWTTDASLMVSSIIRAYFEDLTDSAEELLYKVYFYICLCLSANDDNVGIVYEFYDFILKNSPTAAQSIVSDLKAFSNGCKDVIGFGNIISKDASKTPKYYNYGACVFRLLLRICEQIKNESCLGFEEIKYSLNNALRIIKGDGWWNNWKNIINSLENILRSKDPQYV